MHNGHRNMLSEGFSEKQIRETLSRHELDSNNGCWIWTGTISRNGYGLFARISPTSGVNVRTHVHRFFYEYYKGPIPNGLVVRHKCDVRSCVNPEHLIVGTQAQNIHDMLKRGRGGHPFGEKHHRMKLTTEQVARIRADPRKQSVIAEEYGVWNSHISSIKSGKRRVRG